MNCRKMKRWLALYIGEDLSPRRQQAVQEHLRSCTVCQNQQARYLDAVGQARRWLQRQELTWNETEWKQAVERAVSKEKDTGKVLLPWPFKPVAAYVLMVFFAAALTVLVVSSSFVPWQAPGIAVQDSQDVVAVILVSRDSGLKVQWFFNRNFNLEEDTE